MKRCGLAAPSSGSTHGNYVTIHFHHVRLEEQGKPAFEVMYCKFRICNGIQPCKFNSNYRNWPMVKNTLLSTRPTVWVGYCTPYTPHNYSVLSFTYR